MRQQPLPLKINGVWHNTFDDIIGNSPKELTAAVTAQFGAASLTGDADVEGLDPDAAKVLASVGQGFRLRDDTKKLKLRINPQFKGNWSWRRRKAKKIDMGKGLSFTVVGPMNDEVVALQKEHDDFLKKKAKEKVTAGALAAFTDTSVANLSSLVVLAEAGKKRILFTGDARGDKVLEGLELIGLLKKDGKSTIHVDVLKCPHHGSDRNIDPIFFRRITRRTLRLFRQTASTAIPSAKRCRCYWTNEATKTITIHLTYPIDEIDVGRKADWEKEQAKEKAKKAKNPKIKVRANWSPKKNGLDGISSRTTKNSPKKS